MKKLIIKCFYHTAYIPFLFLLIAYSGCEKKQQGSLDTDKKYKLKLVTSWPPGFPILGQGAKRFASLVEQMSRGQIKIKVYGAGELIPAFEIFDAVKQGSIDLGHTAAYYYSGKHPEGIFFSTIPFGLSGSHADAWLTVGNGKKFIDQSYKKHNIKVFLAGNTGMQMGGWFNKEINDIGDLKGLKMRIPGQGGKVLSNLGAAPVSMAAAEIYTNLERGVIDAAEWIGPFHDKIIGFDKIASYYYYPGWHEPGTLFLCMVNKKLFDSMPKHLQVMLETASESVHMWINAQFEVQNAKTLVEMLKNPKIKIKKFPKPLLKKLYQSNKKLMEATAKKNPYFKKIYEDYLQFKESMQEWKNHSAIHLD